MSLVIYKDGVLAADKQGARKQASFDLVRPIKKTFKSKCGRLAIGVTGTYFSDKDLPLLFEFLLGAVINHHYRCDNPEYTNELGDEGKLRINQNSQHVIVMTRTHVFTVEENQLVDVSEEPWYISGNGVILADVFLTHGLSAQKTIEAVAKQTYEVSKAFSFIQQDSLKPLINKVDV